MGSLVGGQYNGLSNTCGNYPISPTIIIEYPPNIVFINPLACLKRLSIHPSILSPITENSPMITYFIFLNLSCS